MKREMPVFSTFCVYLTEVIALCNIYNFFTIEQGKPTPLELWPWLLLAMGTFLVLHLFLKQDRPLYQVCLVAAVCFFITLVVMSLFFIRENSWVAWGFAWGLFAISAVRASMLNLQVCDVNTVLLLCEIPALGVAFLIWVAEGGVLYLPTYYLVFTIGMLVITLLSLTLARICAVGGDGGGEKNLAALGATAVSLGAIGLLASGIAKISAAGASATVSTTTSLIAWIYNLIASVLSAIWNWFASFFPEVESQPLDLTVEDIQAALETAEESGGNQGGVVFLIIVLTVLILGALIWLFVRYRNLKLSRHKKRLRYTRPRQVVEHVSLWARWKAFWRRRYEAIAFSVRVMTHRNTPQGAAIMLAKIGSSRGHGKAVGESYYHYLHRLAPLCQDQDATVAQTMVELAEILNATLYAPCKTEKTLRPKAYRAMRQAVAQLAR